MIRKRREKLLRRRNRAFRSCAQHEHRTYPLRGLVLRRDAHHALEHPLRGIDPSPSQQHDHIEARRYR